MKRLTHGTQLFGDSETQAYYNRLKEYEDLEEQGKLLKLPCAVGDKLFHVGKDPIRIREFTVYSIENLNNTLIITTDEDISFEEKYIGKTFFLTREEAETALQKMKETEE